MSDVWLHATRVDTEDGPQLQRCGFPLLHEDRSMNSLVFSGRQEIVMIWA